MEGKENLKKLLAGIFFIIGIILIVTVVMVIGIEKGFTQPKFSVTVLFKRVDGLSLGAPIRLSGVSVGTVAKIDFLDERIDGRGVRVTLNLLKRYRKQLEKSTRFSIRTEGLLGGKLIEITSDEFGPYVDLDWPIIGEDPIDVQDVVGVFTQTANATVQSAKALEEVKNELTRISKSVVRLMNRLEQKIMEGNLFKIF